MVKSGMTDRKTNYLNYIKKNMKNDCYYKLKLLVDTVNRFRYFEIAKPTHRSLVWDSAGNLVLFRNICTGNEAHSHPLKSTAINGVKGLVWIPLYWKYYKSPRATLLRDLSAFLWQRSVFYYQIKKLKLKQVFSFNDFLKIKFYNGLENFVIILLEVVYIAYWNQKIISDTIKRCFSTIRRRNNSIALI